jgi:hypothetical protein
MNVYGLPVMAHRVISLRSGIWSLSAHGGLWRVVRLADLWVRGVVNFESKWDCCFDLNGIGGS